MLYVFDFETPANTPATAKKRTALRMSAGIIQKIEIVIPPGPAHLLHLQITDGLHQVWPSNEEGDFAGDNDRIDFEDYYELLQPPFELYAYTWNEDEVYPHRVIIRIGVKEPEVAPEITPPIIGPEEEIIPLTEEQLQEGIT